MMWVQNARLLESEARSLTPELALLTFQIDISTIGLADLRSHLSIIPQDSQCFEGTMRQNLDPEGLSPDPELWKALEQSRLREHVESMDGQLDALVSE